DAIMEADAVVIGPGSLYTSIVPNLLVQGVPEAIGQSQARTFYVSNIKTESGETDDYEAVDHLRVIYDYLKVPLDYVVVNSGSLDETRLKKYQQEKARPVTPVSRVELEAWGTAVIEEALISDSTLAWHDSDRLARAILKALE
ncbi:MAG: 2-phospho-L-lactate transferase CofD family protein, partial [Syntrophomonadaceae bacterium]